MAAVCAGIRLCGAGHSQRSALSYDVPNVTPQLLARYLSGDLLPEEDARVLAWLQAHPELRARLESIPMTERPDVEGFLRQIDGGGPRGLDRIPRRNSGHPDRAARWSARRSVAATAVILGMTLVVALFVLRQPAGERTYAAGVGGRDSVRLEDGSRIVLNAASSLTVARGFGEKRRLVTLTGEAYFDVASDADRPFTVRMSDATATALGTAFVVEAYGGESAAVIVAKGRVMVRSDRGFSVELGAGERGRVHPTSGIIVTDEASLEDALAWQEGRLVFRGTPLAAVARRLERQYGVEILIDDDLQSLRLDASFDGQRIEEVVDLIATALGVEAVVEGEIVTFSKSGGAP